MPPGTTRKRNLATFQDPSLWQALSSSKNTDLQLTNGAVQALHDSQEAFIVELKRVLQEILPSSEDNDNKRSHVLPRHVEQALQQMGLGDLCQEAMQLLEQQEEQQATTKKKKKKSAKITPEMEAEQERLLQASKQKGMDRSA